MSHVSRASPPPPKFFASSATHTHHHHAPVGSRVGSGALPAAADHAALVPTEPAALVVCRRSELASPRGAAGAAAAGSAWAAW